MARLVKIATASCIRYHEAVSRAQYILNCEQQAVEAGENGADIFLLPEGFDSFCASELDCEDGGLYDENTDRSALYRTISEPIPGILTERFGVICKKYHMYILLTFIEQSGSYLYNTAVILDRHGEIVGKYRKTHLCGCEKRCFGVDAGDKLPVFHLDFGCVGIAICMDIYFPEVFRVLTLKGADVIFWPHQTYGPSEETLMIMARSKAIDYNCFMVTSNFASPDYYAPYSQGHALTGRAMIINRDGLVVAETGHYAGTALSTIDLDQPKIGKDVAMIRRIGTDDLKEDLLHFRRPELYGEMIQPCDHKAVSEGKFID